VNPAPKTRVLFVCLGNSCRSQMAEGFARAYGPDVLEPFSAGLAPAHIVAPDTIRAMDEKNIDIRAQFPKSPNELGNILFDIVVNMSGFPLPPGLAGGARNWDVPDPIGEDEETHARVRDQIEMLVMNLILELRRSSSRTR